MPTEQFQALIDRVAQGSEEAVWKVLEQYSELIMRSVRRRLPRELQSKLDSADIVQSAWKSVLLRDVALESLGTPEKFIAYMAGVARNKILETHRKYTGVQKTDSRREVSYDEQASWNGDVYNASSNPLADARCCTPSWIARVRDGWDHAIGLAGDRGQEIVRLRLQGLTHDEVAHQLGISTSTVRRSLQTMLESLSQ